MLIRLKHSINAQYLLFSFLFASFICLCSYQCCAFAEDEHKEKVSAYEELLAQVQEEEEEEADALKVVAASVLASTNEEDVADPDVLNSLSDALEELDELLTQERYEHECFAPFDYLSYDEGMAELLGLSIDLNVCKANIQLALDAVDYSIDLKEAQGLYSELEETYSSGETLLKETKDKVQSKSLWEELSDALDEAEELLSIDANVDDSSAYKSLNEEITALCGEVEESHEEYEEALAKKAAEEAAAKAAAASKSSSNSSSSSSSTSSSKSSSSSSSSKSSTSSSNTWYVSYVSYTAPRLAAGYLCEWRESYFVAHDYTSSGEMIKSKPTYVVIDGVTYKYKSSQLIATTTYLEEIDAYYTALANNGVCFQTCSGSKYLLVFYYPV